MLQYCIFLFGLFLSTKWGPIENPAQAGMEDSGNVASNLNREF